MTSQWLDTAFLTNLTLVGDLNIRTWQLLLFDLEILSTCYDTVESLSAIRQCINFVAIPLLPLIYAEVLGDHFYHHVTTHAQSHSIASHNLPSSIVLERSFSFCYYE